MHQEITDFPVIKLPPSTQRVLLPAATPNPFISPLPSGSHSVSNAVSQRRFYASPNTDNAWTPELLELNSRFIKVLDRARRRHDPTVYRVAYGVREYLRRVGGNGAQGADEELHNWLDRFYMSRVSMRFLISQREPSFMRVIGKYLCLHIDMAISSQQPQPDNHVGVINVKTVCLI